jgi:ribosomal protein S3AE
MSMETITTTILALNGTLIGALIWVVKILIERLSADIKETTRTIRELRDYQVRCARLLETANETLAEMVALQKASR